MACPFFCPQRQLDSTDWEPAPRMPLAAEWSGFCTAPSRGNADTSGASSAGSFQPPESIQRELCNSGYARHRCTYFPVTSETAADAVPDAIRFSLLPDAEGEQRVLYVMERDHRPVAHGEVGWSDGSEVDCSGMTGRFAVEVAAQLKAFVQAIGKIAEREESKL